MGNKSWRDLVPSGRVDPPEGSMLTGVIVVTLFVTDDGREAYLATVNDATGSAGVWQTVGVLEQVKQHIILRDMEEEHEQE